MATYAVSACIGCDTLAEPPGLTTAAILACRSCASTVLSFFNRSSYDAPSKSLRSLSWYQESHTASQLKGSPPGYVGYGRGGVLTDAVRQRPYSVVLLDEVEKAHRDVLDIFYQVFDRGTMRDGEGREIDFRNCVILMTSNLGSTQIDEATAENPSISPGALFDAIHPQLVAHFQPALLARFQTLVYRPLDAVALASIVRLKVAKIAERLHRQYSVALTCDDALTGSLAQLCLARESGARNVDTFINQRILPAVSRELLARMAEGLLPVEIRLSMSPSPQDDNLVIDFIDCSDVPFSIDAPTDDPVAAGFGA
jgi:type VI secretion system protein VasG